jgi:hypothetical protein
MTPGSGNWDGKKQDPDPGLTSRIMFLRSKEQFFRLKMLKFFYAYPDPDPGSGIWNIFDLESGMEKNLDPGSRINIPDPQHCYINVCFCRHASSVQYDALFYMAGKSATI